MPIYVLKCTECMNTWEKLVAGITDARVIELDCEICGRTTKHERQPTSGGFKIR